MSLDHRSRRFDTGWRPGATDEGEARGVDELLPNLDLTDPDDPECLRYDEAIEQLYPHDSVVRPTWGAVEGRDWSLPL